MQNNKLMKHKKTILVAAVPALILIIAIVFLALNRSDDTTLYIGGILEATSVDIASKIPGRVEQVYFKEGDRVETGAILARLESKEMSAKLDQTRAVMDAAKARYDMALNGARSEEKEAAERLYLTAKSQYDLAKNTRERMEKVFRDSLISQQDMDKYEYTFRAAREQMDAAKARFDMATKGARLEEIRMAEGLYNQAANGFREAEAYFEELTLKAPMHGELQKRIIDPGEIVSAGYPVFTVIDLTDIWATIQVKETELSLFKKGSKHRGTVPGLGGKNIEFEVTYIAPMGDFANWKPTNQKGEFDIKTFEIRLRPVDDKDGMRPGMTVNFILNK